MVKKKKKKEHLIQGYIRPQKRILLKHISSRLKKLLELRGVYVLYKKYGKSMKIYRIGVAGIGEAKRLFDRLKSHDRHTKPDEWDYFSAFIIPTTPKKRRYLTDIEALAIRIGNPIGNKVKGRLIGEDKWIKEVRNAIKEQNKFIKEKIEKVKEKEEKYKEYRRRKKKIKRELKLQKRKEKNLEKKLKTARGKSEKAKEKGKIYKKQLKELKKAL